MKNECSYGTNMVEKYVDKFLCHAGDTMRMVL